MESPAYVILGHGHENISKSFEERASLPDGYTLVTLAECGVVTMMPEVRKFLDAFMVPTNKEIFTNPQNPEHKRAIQEIIGKNIHVYKPGNLYPDFTVQAFVDWPSKSGKGIALMKSGVYSFPINAELFAEPKRKEFEFDVAPGFSLGGTMIPGNFKDIITNLYQESEFPTQEVIADNLEKATTTGGQINLSKFKKSVTFSLSTFLESNGPGVYFYVICRSPKDVGIHNWAGQWLLNSGEEGELKKQLLEAPNVIPLLPSAITIAQEQAKKEKSRLNSGGKKSWNTNIRLETPEQFKKTYNSVTRTRALSNVQQSSSGGRRTRRARTSRKRK